MKLLNLAEGYDLHSDGRVHITDKFYLPNQSMPLWKYIHWGFLCRFTCQYCGEVKSGPLKLIPHFMWPCWRCFRDGEMVRSIDHSIERRANGWDYWFWDFILDYRIRWKDGC